VCGGFAAAWLDHADHADHAAGRAIVAAVLVLTRGSRSKIDSSPCFGLGQPM
jgi:hypothetical protein